jgi:hypothetical protein
MGGIDTVSLWFAVAAVAVGIALTVYLIRSERAHDPAPTAPPDQGHMDVQLVNGDDGPARWRFASRLEDRTITLDVFTHRPCSTGADLGWRHELLMGALVLPPGQTAEIPVSGPGDRYEAALGWFVGESPEKDRTSCFIRLRLGG